MFYFKIVIVYTISVFIFHEAGQVAYLFQKQENIHPENRYKFRNGNDFLLLSSCNAQRFHRSQANQAALERQFVSALGHSYYNCNTTKTSVALPTGA